MKKFYTIVALFTLFISSAQIVNIPDASFKARLLAANGWNNVAVNAAGYSMIIDTNQDNEIQVSEALLVKKMDVYNSSYIQSMEGISAFTNLISLNCSYNGLSSLDVSMLPNLKTLDCSRNNISSLNVTGLVNLEDLNCFSNSLTSLSLGSLLSLKKLECSVNQLVILDLSGLSNLTEAYCSTNLISSLSISGLTSLKKLDCSSNQLVNFNPSILSVLEDLNCSNNANMFSINLNGMISLINLNCSASGLNTLDVSSLSNLTTLDCSGNLMTTLNLSGLNNLIYVDCSGCQLNAIDFGDINGLEGIRCGNNQLTNLDLHNLVNLQNIICSNNQITELDTSGLHLLDSFDCRSNLLHSLDMSDNYNLYWFFCSYNLLEYINLKNGTNENYIEIKGNQTLKYICIDESQRDQVYQVLVNTSYYPEYFWYPEQVALGTYCNFHPGGLTYEVQGNSKFDFNTDGCDTSDINLPMKYNITDGLISSDFISSASSFYYMQVPEATHTITPVLENPTYYNVSPAFVTVTFPSTASPFTQDFCITSNGVHNDVEVIIVPIGVARPGFDAHYKMIYKNKGNQVANGTLSFGYPDTIMDLISTFPMYESTGINSVNWSYSNLLPFEAREIDLTFNINSPMETPAVNAGDVIDCNAVIVLPPDEFNADNTFKLPQAVVNSYDPNDKTCLEGTTITPSMVGQYVHYVIRFENTGTFAAQNIVVKDMIDTTKFDIATLVPQRSSHDFYTRINGNRVEFIFENINLPFDDANNDGYVAFKIKTKPTLVLGDTFSNEASIYFDYNFPIITEPAVTTVAALSNQDFDFSSYFTLYPNPAKEVLNFEVKNEIGVKSIQVYNTLGQIVLAVTNASTTRSIDIASLNAGAYFIKVTTDRGSANSKFIKE